MKIAHSLYRAAALCWFTLLVAPASAQVPQLINYQGRVTVDTVNFDGTGLFKFAFVDASGTTAYWTNDGTHLDGSEPDTAVTLTVSKGLYSVLLGDATIANMQVVPATVFTNSEVYLRVWFNDGQNGSQLLTPDQRIAAVGYAMMAGTAQTVADEAITSEKIAPGAVGSAQLTPNLSLSGTITAANFTGNGQGLTGLSASNLSTGTLPNNLLSQDVPLLDGTNTWTGAQTFSNITLASASPNLWLKDTSVQSQLSPTSAGFGLAADSTDARHYFSVIGINMQTTPTGFGIVNPVQDAWGLGLELDYSDGIAVEHEAYFTDGSSDRPFAIGYSQPQVATVASIVSGTATITNASASGLLVAGRQLQFADLEGNSGVDPNTTYAIDTVLSATTFTFMPAFGGDAINATATGGHIKVGGWGGAVFTVPLTITTSSYDDPGQSPETALEVVNTQANHQTVVRFDNTTGSQICLDLNQQWRVGTDFQGLGVDNNFYLMDFATQNAVIQVDSGDRVAVGFPNPSGYIPHTNAGTLDVNGALVASGTALPSEVDNAFIVVSGTAYIGSNGSWRALSFAP